MLSLKYSWLGAGVFALFSCYVAMSGMGVSTTSKDVSLAGSVSINPHTKLSPSISVLSPNSEVDSSNSANLSDTAKSVVEVPLSAPVVDFPQNAGAGSKIVRQSEPTPESSKVGSSNAIGSTSLATTSSNSRNITTSKDMNRTKEGEKKGGNHDKTNPTVVDNRDSLVSPTILPRLITTTTTSTTIPSQLTPQLPSLVPLRLSSRFSSNRNR